MYTMIFGPTFTTAVPHFSYKKSKSKLKEYFENVRNTGTSNFLTPPSQVLLSSPCSISTGNFQVVPSRFHQSQQELLRVHYFCQSSNTSKLLKTADFFPSFFFLLFNIWPQILQNQRLRFSIAVKIYFFKKQA